MARIVEELIVRDGFSGPMRLFLEYTEEADRGMAGITQRSRQAGSAMVEFAADGNRSTNRLLSGIRNLAAGYLGLQGVLNTLNLSDTFAQTTARLDLMNDGLQTTGELTEMIYASAQRSRGSFTETAALVAKLGTLAGDAFSSSGEIVAFAEQLNKQLTISGAGKWEGEAALFQLTQGLASGTLRGEELNSVLEQAPMIAQTIADYMGVSIGEMRDLASEGMVTADIVKNAMFAAADETNAKFEKMPMTWAQVWTTFANTAIMASRPLLSVLSWIANNIAIIAPLVLGAGAAFAVFQVAANSVKIATAVTAGYRFVIELLRFSLATFTKQTYIATAATSAFMGTLAANPITWVVMGISLLIGILYAGVAAWNHFTGASVSATGIIVGIIFSAGAFVLNFLIGIYNAMIQAVWSIFVEPFLGIVEFVLNAANGGFTNFGNAVENLIGQIISWFLNLGKVVTQIIDAIFGTNWTAGLSSLQDELVSRGKNDKAITIERTAPTIEHRFNYSDSWNKGYNIGSNFNPFDYGSKYGEADYSSLASDAVGTLGDIADDTKAIKKSVDMSQEDLKSFIDLATRKYVNQINLTAQTPVITINGANTGNTEADRKALGDTIRDLLLEQAAAASVRTTARTF